MKGNESKIAFICFHLFLRIGAFQWVTREKNKKIPLGSTRFPGCGKRAHLHRFAPFLLAARALGSASHLGNV
jgi:hypothetical protein